MVYPLFQLIGITHRSADLALREQFVRSSSEIASVLSDPGSGNGVILSTCNRFEIYWWGEAEWPRWFLSLAEENGLSVPCSAVVRHQSHAAIRHLFSVAAGLDSQVLGENEILGQVRRAWARSRELNASNRQLDLIFAAAIAAGRRVRRETSLGRHPASIGSVAVEAAAEVYGGLADRVAVVMGAGEAARGVVAALEAEQARIHVVVRHLERAAPLLEQHRISLEPWEQLDRLLGAAELVFAATSAPHAFLRADRFPGPRNGLVIVDLGVPRNVDPAVRQLDGVTVLDLDRLHGIRPGRMPELNRGVEAARLILEREVGRLTGKLTRWCAPAMAPLPPARLDTAG